MTDVIVYYNGVLVTPTRVTVTPMEPSYFHNNLVEVVLTSITWVCPVDGKYYVSPSMDEKYCPEPDHIDADKQKIEMLYVSSKVMSASHSVSKSASQVIFEFSDDAAPVVTVPELPPPDSPVLFPPDLPISDVGYEYLLSRGPILINSENGFNIYRCGSDWFAQPINYWGPQTDVHVYGAFSSIEAVRAWIATQNAPLPLPIPPIIIEPSVEPPIYSDTPTPHDPWDLDYFPFKGLVSYPRLFNLIYGIWAKRKGKP